MKIRLAAPLMPDSIVDGEGIRTVVWTQGCSHNCKGCHNKETHDFTKGEIFDVDEVIKELENIKNQTGITLSGGDPMFQAEACSLIAFAAHSMGLDVWCFTGFTFEEVIKNESMKKLLDNVDILVDGKFVLEEKSYDIYFRGSRNQRIIDVPKSLKENKVILVEKYMQDKEYDSNYKKPDYMFV